MKIILTTLHRLYLAFKKFDREAREQYEIEDKAHRAKYGIPLSAW